jgi:hypothetical protein
MFNLKIYNIYKYIYKYILDSIKIYFNPILDRNNKAIFKDNNNKSGIYMLTNKMNGKQYVGSSVNLNKRI